MALDRIPPILREIYRLAGELGELFPGRHFTPDGHLVGSIGECIAAYEYGLDLCPPSTEGYDATKGNLRVEIKATQRKSVALRSKPEHLLVIRINADGSWCEEYNGPGEEVWDLVRDKPLPKNGQYQVSLAKLRRLMDNVPQSRRLPQLRKQIGKAEEAKL